jgi:hypothetical protein
MRDALQIPSASQLEGQWEDVPPDVGHGAVQGTVQNLHPINVANYGMADYQDPSGVSNHVRA